VFLIYRKVGIVLGLLLKELCPKKNIMKKLIYSISAIVALSVISSSCSKDGCTNENALNFDEGAEDDDASCLFAYEQAKASLKHNYAELVFANYEDAYTEAVKLQTAIDVFLASKNSSNFEACKTAWKASRIPYGQTEAFRFANGPIDDEDGPEGALNAWPLDEGYVDYISGKSTSGIINDGVTSITSSSLEALNEQGGEKNISIGYHAIEFLLWGQDSPDASLKTPGSRPYTDYLTTGGTASNQQRRSDYLKATMDLLLSHLLSVKNEWDSSISGNYRTTFLALDADVAVTNLIASIGILSKSELAGERIFVALDNKDQEDEHSCFSDNTNQDIILNAQGIQNVFLGTYTRLDGSVVSGGSLYDLLMYENETLAESIKTLCEKSVSSAKSIPFPFDYALTQESTGGTGPIMLTVTDLQSLGDELSKGATALGLTISTDLPD